VLSLSPTAQKWDLRTEVVITMVRDFLTNSPPTTISSQQAMFLKDPGVKGKMWVSKVTLPPPPDDDVRAHVFSAIAALGNGKEEYTKPALEPVGAEWVGFRDGVSDNEAEPAISEKDKYDNLIKEAKSRITILYFHGGSNYLMDPVSTRPVASKYATTAGGRVFSIRYRLAPQGPFPAALLDALVAYLSLLYPPPGAFHDPVPAASIVVCGDSAGGNISMSLLQLLLQMHRSAPVGEFPTVKFHGADVSVPLPAGVALNSPSLDLTRSMHWDSAYSQFDYLPPPSFSPAQSPPCDAWPTDPKRVDLWCEGSALSHPLVSPLSAKSWEGSPPIFMVCGEELLTYECKIVARNLAAQGVPVMWEQYEAMPHCFALFLSWIRGSDMSYAGWLDFVVRVVEAPKTIEAQGSFVFAKSLKRKKVDLQALSSMSDEDVLAQMEEARMRLVRRFS
jgi:acetyl esterase/lipase